MAATLRQSRLHNTRAGKSRIGAEVFQDYFVSVSEATTGQRVIELAQNATAPEEAVPDIDDIFTTPLDSQPDDASLLVESITADQRMPGPENRLEWIVRVTYRNPSLAARPNPELSKPPVERAPEFWTEELVVTETRDTGKNEVEITWPWTDADGEPAKREPNTLGPVTNAAGRRFGQLPTEQVRYPVFVYRRNVSSPFAWIILEGNFRKTVCRGDWDVYGTGAIAADRTAAWLGARSSETQYYGSLRYYELTVRVLHNPNGHDIIQRNEGSNYWLQRADGSWTVATQFNDGLPIEPPISLDRRGQLATDFLDIEPERLRFRDTEAVDYTALTTILAGLS